MNIVDGKSKGLWFEIGTKGTRARKARPSVIVLHHTAGEGGAAQVHRTLKNRGLSVHFVIDNDGVVTQMANFREAVTSHAGSMNERSIGIEISNRGVPPAVMGHKREVYMHNFRGKPREFLRFHKAQVKAACDLIAYLSAECNIPRVWPSTQDVLDKVTLADYVGILGHHHLVPTKIDPSPHLWDALYADVHERC